MNKNDLTPQQAAIKNEIDGLMAAQNARIEQAYQKERNSKALNLLAGILIISLALVGLVGWAKYQAEQDSQKKQEQITKSIKN